MAYGSARYSAYQKKNKGVIVSEVQSSRYGQKNTGSTLGYVGGNFAAGLGGIVEGLSDLFIATGALATGDVDYAKYVFKDNVVGDWHESITSDYNPGKVMQFLGDVSHGLGQSSVFLLDAVGVPVGTVGFFGGMIGQGISGAAAKTGDVGFKEVAYGTLSGAAEGALEKAMGGMSKLAGNLSSSVVKNTTKTAVRKGLFKQVLSDAASEFGEEFLSEYVDVALQRATGVDKQASTTLKDAIYSGFVGAVSGAVSAGAGDIARYTANQRNGARIIKSGNAQTLINTATAVADKMAAQGTDFKKASEWVKALRAEVDAYNKLTPEAQKGARGQTILGEMQASLYFAETQAVFNGVQVGIQNADEEKRAALAEYVNLTVDKSKRSKDYTAEDVAKNTDNIAWQLSVLHYANHIADLDAVMAQEEAVQGVIREEQGAAAVVPEAAQVATENVQTSQGTAEAAKSEAVTVELEGGETLTFREAKQPLPTHEEKIARAKERAEKWRSFEEKTQASAQEMNLARSYVKNFDELDNHRRSAILETVRSAKNAGTKVDEVALRGVVNLMSLTRSNGEGFGGELEVRFAQGIKEDGLYTRVNGKPVIVIDAKAESGAAMRSTVIHELVHYVENKQGYKALADYVMKTARSEKKDAIRKEYEDFYKENNIAYTEAELESEVVASLVGERLQSEKFLKRYAEKDASMIKRAAGFIKGLRKATKDADEEAERITGEIMLRMDRALAGADVRDSDGGKKYSIAGESTTETNEAKAKRATEEKEAKEAVERVLADRVRTYTKTEFRSAFNRAGSVTESVIGALLNGKRVGIKNQELSEIISDVYIAMYKASFDGDVGAVDAVKKIAQKAAHYMVETQTVYDPETKRHVSLGRYLDDADILESYENALADSYFESFSKAGKDLKTYKNIATLQKRSEELKKMYFDYKDLEKYKKQVAYDASELTRMANMQKRKASDEGVRLLAKALGDTVNKKGIVISAKVDAALAQASDFYNPETNAKFFGDEDGYSLTDYAQDFDRNARQKIDRLTELRKNRQGKQLTVAEMRLWAEILGAMRATINAYNGIFLEGRWFDRTEVSGKLAKDIYSYFGFGEKKKYDNVFLQGLYDFGRKIKQNYLYSVVSPETLIESFEGYSHDGILKSFFHSIRDAAMLKEKMFAELIDPFDDYLDAEDNKWDNEKNKKVSFRDKLNQKNIYLFGSELTLGEAIYTYCLCKREHAQAGLAKEGIKIYDQEGRLKKQIRGIDAEKARDWLYNQFDEVDKKYIAMVEEFFNKTSTKIKTESDLEYLGYTNTIGSYYIPILRDRFSRDRKSSDIRSRISDIITVYNERFNQHITQNVKPCEVTNIQAIVSMHANGLSDYANLYMPLKSFDRLYNAPVILDDGRNTTIREMLNDIWPKAENYLSDLFADIQGSPRDSGRFDTLNNLAQRLTNAWVPSVLSANVSVILNQTTSYISAAQSIEPTYLARAMGAIGHSMKEIGERADKYSKIILARSFEEGAIRSQTNVEQVNKIGKTLGKGIEFTDRQICVLLFHASELKAEAEGVGAIGTEDNAKRAAEICDKVIQDTQSVTSAADRGAWQRSPNLFSRTVTQFAGDSLKQFSMLYSSVSRYISHKQRVKQGDNSYEKYLKDDANQIAKSSATLLATSAYMAAIAWLLRVAFNSTEDEPEEEALAVLGDFTGNVIGVLPLVSDIYSLWNEGYEITPTSIDLVNDTVKNTKDVFDLVGGVVSGKYISEEDAIRTVKNSAVTFSSLFGIPLNPILKQATGIVRRVSPTSVYWYDSAFTQESSTKELNRALEKGDERLAQKILELKYKREMTGSISDEDLLEIIRLYQLTDENGDYRSDVLPKSIPQEITSNKERDRFEKIYDEATAAVSQLINSLEYKNLTDDERIYAIKNTYKLYYDRAQAEIMGKEWTNGMAYSLLLPDTSNLYLAQAKKAYTEAYEDENGKEVSVKDQLATYLEQIEVEEKERKVIAYALGYKGKDNKAEFLAYVNSLNLSEEEKNQIAKRLGFDIENGLLTEKKQK